MMFYFLSFDLSVNDVWIIVVKKEPNVCNKSRPEGFIAVCLMLALNDFGLFFILLKYFKKNFKLVKLRILFKACSVIYLVR